VKAVQNQALLVLGMHRSGTSAVARMLNLLGVELGSTLLEPGYSNEKGFWEHRRAYELDDQLLQRLGLSWHDLRDLPTDWRDHPATKRAEVEIRELIAAEFAGCPLWAIKEPRMCRLAPLWIDAMTAAKIQPKALIVLRDPREVAASLRVRDQWTAAHTYLLWLRHVMEAELATRHIPRSIVLYDELLADWRGVAERIAHQLHVDWPRSMQEAGDDIAHFLDRGERHHRGERMLRAGEAAPELLLRLYEIGRRAQHEPGALDEFSALIDRVGETGAVYAGGIADLARRGEEQEALAGSAKQWLDVAGPALEEARSSGVRFSEATALAGAWRDSLWHTLTGLAAQGNADITALLTVDRQQAEAHRQGDRQHAEAWRDGLWHALTGLAAQSAASTAALLEADKRLAAEWRAGLSDEVSALGQREALRLATVLREEWERGELQRLRMELDAKTEQLQASTIRGDALQRRLEHDLAQAEARERDSAAEIARLRELIERRRGLLQRLFGGT
jgi:hypothetical protein